MKATIKTCVDRHAELNGITKAEANTQFRSVMDTIADILCNEGGFTVTNVLSIEVKKRAARDCRNPVNNETVHVPARRVLKIKALKGLSEKLNA